MSVVKVSGVNAYRNYLMVEKLTFVALHSFLSSNSPSLFEVNGYYHESYFQTASNSLLWSLYLLRGDGRNEMTNIIIGELTTKADPDHWPYTKKELCSF